MARWISGFCKLGPAVAFLVTLVTAQAAPVGVPDPIFADGFEPGDKRQ